MIIIMYPTVFYAMTLVNKGEKQHQKLIDQFNNGQKFVFDDRIAYSIVQKTD